MYNNACKFMYHIAVGLLYGVTAVLLIAVIVILPIRAILFVSEAAGEGEISLQKAVMIYLFGVAAVICGKVLFGMAMNGKQVVERETAMQKLLILDISPDKFWYGFYHQDRKTGETKCLTSGEYEDDRIAECLSEDGIIKDMSRFATLLHRALRNDRLIDWNFCSSDKEYSRVLVRMHISNALSETHKEKIEKMLSFLNLSLYFAENADEAEQHPMSGEKARARYGDWRKE